VESDSYFADLETFTGDRKLMSQMSLGAHHTANGRAVPIVVPTALLTAGTYYTVQLHPMNSNGHSTAVYRFTFAVLARDRELVNLQAVLSEDALCWIDEARYRLESPLNCGGDWACLERLGLLLFHYELAND